MTGVGVPASPMARADWALLLVLSGLWGGSFYFFKVLVGSLPPLTIVFGRVLIAALLLHLVLALRREAMPRDGATWRAFLIMGLLNNVVPFGLLIFSETRIASGLAAILNATTPMFTVILAQVFGGGERLTAGRVVGIGIGFLGVMVLMAPDLVAAAGSSNLVGEAACLLAALSYGLANIFGRRFRSMAPLKVATGQLSASALIALPLCLVLDQPWALPVPPAGAWVALLGLAVPSTAVAYLIFFRILARAGATNVSLVTLLVPVSATFLGVFLLGEKLGSAVFSGMGLIGLGLICIDGRALRVWRRPMRA